MKLPRRILKRGRVEIIPMIDTILILLIFYMSFSTFSKTEKQMDARMPERQLVQPGEFVPPPPLEILIHVRDAETIIVNGMTFNPATLRDSLMTLGLAAPDSQVTIEAEPGTTYQAVINALDACAQAKLFHLAFRPLASPADS